MAIQDQMNQDLISKLAHVEYALKHFCSLPKFSRGLLTQFAVKKALESNIPVDSMTQLQKDKFSWGIVTEFFEV